MVDDENRENPGEVIVEASVSAPTTLVALPAEGFTDLQARFIDHYIALGGKGTEAALAAGYGEGGAAQIAMRNLAKPKVQAEIMRRLKLQGGTALAAAIGRLLRVIESSTDDKAAVQAALGLMDRFGMAPPKGPAVAIQQNFIGATQVTNILNEVAERRAQRLASSGS